jgi:hypothetical protein
MSSVHADCTEKHVGVPEAGLALEKICSRREGYERLTRDPLRSVRRLLSTGKGPPDSMQGKTQFERR